MNSKLSLNVKTKEKTKKFGKHNLPSGPSNSLACLCKGNCMLTIGKNQLEHGKTSNCEKESLEKDLENVLLEKKDIQSFKNFIELFRFTKKKYHRY